MNFISIDFAVFLVIVLAGYYCLRWQAQNVLLLLASYVFYGWWDARFLLLLILSTVCDYFCGIGLEQSKTPFSRQLYLFVSLLVNLGVLGFFKYFNFFAESAAVLLQSIGIDSSLSTLNVILPVGVSFYTFQTLSYTIDVYRGNLQPCRSFPTFALYVSFFPQLVAGPIERATHLLPQLERKRRVCSSDWSEGGLLILLGFFKKAAIANSLAPLVDVLFSYPDTFSGTALLLGVYFFSIQIYCDFSGYTDIARGTAKLLGIDLMENFNQPYFSRSITEFWRRWHISLSTWLRDYLYIPLGGNRFGTFHTYKNLLVTMVLGGLWHGASWLFIIWGTLHGLFLAGHKIVVTISRNENAEIKTSHSFFRTSIAMIVTFHLVALTWIFFRADSLASSITILGKILTFESGEFWLKPIDLVRVGVLTFTLICIDVPQYLSRSHVVFLRYPWWVQACLYALLIVIALVFGGLNEEVPFIYFQF